MEEFIKKLKKNKDILNDYIHPDPYYDGWSLWNYWDGKVDDKTYKIRLSNLYAEPDDGTAKWLTEAIIKIAKESGLLNVTITDVKMRMINPDRCVYESTLNVV